MVRIFFILVLVSVYGITFCQDSKFSVGIELKPTMAWLTGNRNIGINENRLGYAAGLSSDYSINQNIAIKSGLLFERKGSHIDMIVTDEDGISAGTVDVYSNYDYLILPVLGSFYTKGKVVNGYVNIGPYIGFLLNQELIMDAVSDIPKQKFDGTSNTKKIDLGLALGTGISIPIDQKIVFELGIEAEFGFMNSSKIRANDDGKTIPNSVGLLVGVKYTI